MQPHASRTALVTGAASGIGRAIAQRLAADGAAVAVLDRNAAAARETAERIVSQGGRASAFIADLADTVAVQAVLGEVDRQLGAPDIVVNNAGIAASVPVLDYPLAHWELTVAINLTAPLLIAQHTLRAMKARRWGRIVNIASISGIRASLGRLGYGTSKGALIAMTRQFAIEAARWGVTVNAVAPGPIATPMVEALHDAATVEGFSRLVPMRRYGSTDEIAHAIAFLASDGASYITGHTLAVDGGFLAAGLLADDPEPIVSTPTIEGDKP